METWHDRLIIALAERGHQLRDLIGVTGLKPPSVYAWAPTATKRTKMMDADNAAKVCGFLKINSSWLFDGIPPSGIDRIDLNCVSREKNHEKPDHLSLLSNSDSSSNNAESVSNVTRLRTRNEYVVIPQYETGGSMGRGVVLRDQPGVIDSWSVSEEWIRKNARNITNSENLCIVTGFGDSMRPMYNPGDPLLVDRGVKTLEADGIYFFRVNGEGFIKRLQRIPTKRGMSIIAISANPEYERFEIEPEMDFEILAKVIRVWCGTDF